MARKRASGRAGRFLRRLWRFTARLDIGSILIALAAFAVAIGSFFPAPPLATLSTDAAWQDWQTATADKFGGLVDFLLEAGVLPYLRYLFFGLPLSVLTVVTLLCTLERWPRVWRGAFTGTKNQATVRVALSRIPAPSSGLAYSIGPPVPGDLLTTVRTALEQRGYHFQTQPSAQGLRFNAERNRLTGLATLATHMGVVLLLIGAVATAALGWREEIVVDPGATVSVGQRPVYWITNQGLEILRHNDGTVSSYLARVGVKKSIPTQEDGVSFHTIQLNAPLHLQAFSLHLVGFEPTPQGNRVEFKAVHDPGFGPVVLGGFMLLAGLAVTLAFPRRTIMARPGADEQVVLYGKSSRYAYGFGAELRQIATECGSILEDELQGDRPC